VSVSHNSVVECTVWLSLLLLFFHYNIVTYLQSMIKHKEIELWSLVEDEISQGGSLHKEEMMLDIKTFLEAIRDNNRGVAKFMATSLAIKFKKVAEDEGRMI
jgi:hypothetical protein